MTYSLVESPRVLKSPQKVTLMEKNNNLKSKEITYMIEEYALD